VTEARDQPVEPVSRWPRRVAKRQLVVLGKLANEIALPLQWRETPELAHFVGTAAFGDRDCMTRFRRIEPDESFAMMPHDPPSMRLYPAIRA
jgi:hypothetical protein